MIGLVGAMCLLVEASRTSDYLPLVVGLPVGIVSFIFLVKPTWGTAGVGVVVSVAALLYLSKVREKETRAFRPIASMVLELTKARAKPDQEVSLVGKVLVWDIPNDHIHSTQYQLPVSLRAKTTNEAMTIFMVSKVRSEKIGAYHRVHTKLDFTEETDTKTTGAAYRDNVEVAVIRWPEKKLIAWHSVLGSDPEQRISHQGDEHGNYEGRLTAWIKSLRRDPAPVQSTGITPTVTSSSIPNHSSQRTWTEPDARAEAVRRYPQLGVSNSPMNRAFVEKYQKLKVNNPAALRDPAWPLTLADEVAR